MLHDLLVFLFFIGISLVVSRSSYQQQEPSPVVFGIDKRQPVKYLFSSFQRVHFTHHHRKLYSSDVIVTRRLSPVNAFQRRSKSYVYKNIIIPSPLNIVYHRVPIAPEYRLPFVQNCYKFGNQLFILFQNYKQ